MLCSFDACANRASGHGTARLVAVSSARLMDLTLYHAPSHEVNKLLNIQAMRNVCEKFGVQEDSLGLRHVAVHQGSCDISMNTCMWATLHFLDLVLDQYHPDEAFHGWPFYTECDVVPVRGCRHMFAPDTTLPHVWARNSLSSI